jgi:hypothetical protein
MRRVLLALVVVLSTVGAGVAATGTATAQAAEVTAPADLHIEQPAHVGGDVGVDTSGEVPRYSADGQRLFVALQNVPDDEVLDYGVSTPGASLTRNTDLGAYEFRADQNGTYEVYWVTAEEREVTVEEGNRTVTRNETVRVRYTAEIRVGTAQFDHLPAGRIDEVRRDAENWSAFVGAIRSDRVAGPDANIENEVQSAINLLRLKHNPTAALTGNFTQIIILVGTTLGGLILLFLWLAWSYVQRRRDIRELRERYDLDAERADLEDELTKYQEYDRLSSLEGMDWNDIYDDQTARAFRETFGETVLDGWVRLSEVLEPRNLVYDRVAAMADEYVVRGDPNAATDGGHGGRLSFLPAADAGQVSAETHTFGDGKDTDLSVAAVVDGVAWDDPELQAFDLASADLDPDGGAALEGATLDEVVERYDVQLERDFDGDRELLAKYLYEFLETVEDHHVTDSDGRPRTLRTAMNQLLRGLRILEDREDAPLARLQAEHVEWILANHDREEEARAYVDRVVEGRA